jgi:Cu2+-exporting ATPase
MKTSVIEVHGMLSVLSVADVEKRIGDVPGVESVTVNFAAGNAAVRYDETRLNVADIKSGVRQRGYEADIPTDSSGGTSDGHSATRSSPTATAVAAAPTVPSATPVETPVSGATDRALAAAPATAPKASSSAGAPPVAGHASGFSTPTTAPDDAAAATPKPDSDAMPAGMKMSNTAATGSEGANVPKGADSSKPEAPAGSPSLWQRLRSWVSPAASTPVRKSPAATDHEGADHGHQEASGGTSSPKSSDMAREMGHSGNMDLPAMVRDMRNRFWICLVFTVPIFIYSPMGKLFSPPAPPFGLPLNEWLFGLASAAVLYPTWPFFVSAWRALLKRVEERKVVPAC